jgi:hypothetical protein
VKLEGGFGLRVLPNKVKGETIMEHETKREKRNIFA